MAFYDSQTLGIIIGVLATLIVIEVILYIVFSSQYRKLINNESKLCPTANCSNPTAKCNLSPFKVNEDGSITCAPPNIFDGKVPNLNF